MLHLAARYLWRKSATHPTRCTHLKTDMEMKPEKAFPDGCKEKHPTSNHPKSVGHPAIDSGKVLVFETPLNTPPSLAV